jgi:hypothetical protein
MFFTIREKEGDERKTVTERRKEQEQEENSEELSEQKIKKMGNEGENRENRVELRGCVAGIHVTRIPSSR